MSMSDGKVVNVWHENPSTQRCPFCRMLRSQFNDMRLQFIADPELLSHVCLSVLHFGLRSFENLLNVGFYKYVKKGMVSLTYL